MMRVVVLAGGSGGAKMAEGFDALDDVALTVIANVGDDEAFHGLWVSPDVDSVTYALAGRLNQAQGWGVADEGNRALQTLAELGQETWMTLGDRDFGLHIWRSMRRARGDRPSDIAADAARAFGVTCQIVLPTDDVVQTRIRTQAGWLSMQEYFVRERHGIPVQEVAFTGAEEARPTPEVLKALADADLIVISPSNPVLSIAPILAVPGVREAVLAAGAPKLAVSPLIGGAAVKGPAVDVMSAAGHRPDATGVAEIYAGLIDHLVIDTRDAAMAAQITPSPHKNPVIHKTDILMRDAADKTRLARALLTFCQTEPAL